MAKGKEKTIVNLIPKDEINEHWLTLKQEAFCQAFVCQDKDLFWNGVQCYIEVYDPDTSKPNWYKTACSSASQILSNIKVIHRINDLLEEWWLNDNFVDKQLLFLVQQHEDKKAKLWAIKEYNNLKKRITKKIEHSWEVSLWSILEEIWEKKPV